MGVLGARLSNRRRRDDWNVSDVLIDTSDSSDESESIAGEIIGHASWMGESSFGSVSGLRRFGRNLFNLKRVKILEVYQIGFF